MGPHARRPPDATDRRTGLSRPGAVSTGKKSGSVLPKAAPGLPRNPMRPPWRTSGRVLVLGPGRFDELDGAPAETIPLPTTEALAASERLNRYDPRQYVRELITGNVGPIRLLRVAMRAFSINMRRRLGLLGYLPLQRNGKPAMTGETLDLQPGDLVQVRSTEEIATTLNEKGTNRGLWFDWEMIPYCGGRIASATAWSGSSTTRQASSSSSRAIASSLMGSSVPASTVRTVAIPAGDLPVLARGMAASGRRADAVRVLSGGHEP